MSTTRLLVPLMLFASVASAQSITDRAEKDEVITMRREEPAMRSAMQKARNSLDGFLAKAKSPAPGTSLYAVKVAISVGRDTEYFWVNQFTWEGDAFTGRINNEARVIKNVALGQVYKFTRGQIVDWTYSEESSGKIIGNFTACALLSKEPPAQAAEFMRRYGLDCS